MVTNTSIPCALPGPSKQIVTKDYRLLRPGETAIAGKDKRHFMILTLHEDQFSFGLCDFKEDFVMTNGAYGCFYREIEEFPDNLARK